MSSRTLSDKRILLTGASSGIGRALAVEACRRGAKVLGVARNEAELANTAALTDGPGHLETLVGDVTCPDDRRRMVSRVEQTFGGLDVLVNNAGIGATGHFQHAGEERLRRIMEVNFFGVTELTRLSIPLLKEGADPAILMISSVAGRRAIPSRTEYSASKFALVGFSEALRAELVKDGVEVTVACPGLTESNFERNMLENNAAHSLHGQRSMNSAQAAGKILDALEARIHEATFTFKGKLLVGLNRLAPRFIDRKMAGFVRKLYPKGKPETVAAG